MEVQRALDGLPDVTLAAIIPSGPAELAQLAAARGLSARLLADPTWGTHRAYGFRRGGFRQIWLSPATWLAYARLVRQGRRLHRPTGDVYGLGGDVLIDARGRVAWIYRSRHPADRPTAAEIVRRLETVDHLPGRREPPGKMPDGSRL